MERYTTLLPLAIVAAFLLSRCSTVQQEPPEISTINSIIDSLKQLDVTYQSVPFKDATGNSSLLSVSSNNGQPISYNESGSTAYFGSDGTVIFVEITNWDAVHKNTQYIEQYYLRGNKTFYVRKFQKTLQDSTLVEAGETFAIPETWSIKLLTRDEMLNAIEANVLNYSRLEGKWFEVAESTGDKRYELTRYCDAEPFNITFEEKSLLINPGQMATRYSILSTTPMEGNLKLTTQDSMSGSTDTLDFIIARGEPGVIMFFQNDERKVLVHENSLALVSIREDNSGCEQ